MMMSGSLKLCRWAIAAAAFLLVSEPAFAEKRVALVVGNSTYAQVGTLANPANDAKAVTQLLTDSGFEVSTASDLSQGQMREAVSEFAGKVAAKGADTVAIANKAPTVDPRPISPTGRASPSRSGKWATLEWCSSWWRTCSRSGRPTPPGRRRVRT
mgnify:CR=1 FL=1